MDRFRKIVASSVVLLGAGHAAGQESSSQLDLTLIIQTPGINPAVLDGLADINLDFTDIEATQAGVGASFCLYVEGAVSLSIDSSNSLSTEYILSGTGPNVRYRLDLVSNESGKSITPGLDGFSSGVPERLTGEDFSGEPTCSSGDNLSLKLEFPEDGESTLQQAKAQASLDGVAYQYVDVLTFTIAPVI